MLKNWKRIQRYTSSIKVLVPNKWSIGKQIVRKWMEKKEVKSNTVVRGGMTPKDHLRSLTKGSAQVVFDDVRLRLRLRTHFRKSKSSDGKKWRSTNDENLDPSSFNEIPTKKEEIMNKIMEGLIYLRLVDDSPDSMLQYLNSLNRKLDYLKNTNFSTKVKRKRDEIETLEELPILKKSTKRKKKKNNKK